VRWHGGYLRLLLLVGLFILFNIFYPAFKLCFIGHELCTIEVQIKTVLYISSLALSGDIL